MHNCQTNAVVFGALILAAASHAQPCDPARVPDLAGFAPLSTASAVGEWDPDGAGPLPSQLVVAGYFLNGDKFLPSRIIAWDGTQLHDLGPGLTTPPAALASFYGNLIAGGTDIQPVGGTSLGRIAQWNGTTWQSLPGGTIQGSVNALRVHSGWLYVGGSFSAVGSTSAINIARTNGISWQALGAGLNGSVQSLEVFNNEVVAGGSFTASGASPARHIASWNGQSWQAFADGPGAAVKDIAVRNGQLVALRASTLWTWNGTQWSNVPSDNLGWLGGFTAIHAIGDKLFAGGSFQSSGVDPVSSILAWDGTSWSHMQGGLRQGGSNASIDCMTAMNGDLFVGGGITHSGGTPANGVARWTENGWRSIGSGWSKYAVKFICATANDVYAMDEGKNLARWHEQTWVSLPQFPVQISAMQIYSLQGSLFAVLNGSIVFRLQGDQWIQIGNPLPTSVTSLVDYQGVLVAGGTFKTFNGVAYNGVAAWNGAAWLPMGEGLLSNSLATSGVQTLLVFKNDLYAFGLFDHSGPTALQGFTRWNGSEWIALDTGGTPNPEFPIEYRRELVTLGNGSFRAWNGQSWRTAGAPFGGQVLAAKVYNGRLIVGGHDIGAPQNDLVQWTGSGWKRIQPGPNYGHSGSDGTIFALESFEGKLFVGGSFLFMEDQPANNFARISICSLCPADLNNDALVDDADFCEFILSYDVMDCTASAMPVGCPSDFNADGLVDDSDFTRFVTDYAAFVCPEPD